MKRSRAHWIVIGLVIAMAGCGGSRPPVAVPQPPPDGPSAFPGATAPSTARPPDPPPVPADDPVTTNALLPWADKPIEVINGPDSPLKPVYFTLDSDQIDEAGKKILTANAEVLRTYSTWVVTIEGHCDERGTAEYNLALGDRRALAARAYLISLGIAADRLRTVSYGKEFPFDPGHTEEAWLKNRRAHFMLTSK